MFWFVATLGPLLFYSIGTAIKIVVIARALLSRIPSIRRPAVINVDRAHHSGPFWYRCRLQCRLLQCLVCPFSTAVAPNVILSSNH